MKITCNKDLLQNHINIVNKSIANKINFSILECILLTANENGFILTCNNLDLAIQTKPIEASIEEFGEIALETKLFYDIIRKLPNQDITISKISDKVVEIICGSSKIKITTYNVNEFPALPTILQSENNRYTISQLELKNMIKQTIFSIGQDPNKPNLLGSLFELKENALHVISIDGYRISFRKSKLIESSSATEIIIPSKTLQELVKILGIEETSSLSLYTTNKHVLFDLGNAIVISRLIIGEFIRYGQSFSNEFKTKIVVKKNILIQALDRASLVSRDNKKLPIVFELNNNQLEIHGKSELGSVYEKIEAKIEGEDMTIAFNPKYFVDALKAINEEVIQIYLIAPLSPCTILPLESDDFKYLLLPLRL